MNHRCPLCGAQTELGAVSRIQSIVADYYNISLQQMRSARRGRNVAWPRQVAMYLARETTGKSLPNIARQFNRDHTTVMFGIKAVEERIERFPSHSIDVEYLRGKVEA